MKAKRFRLQRQPGRRTVGGTVRRACVALLAYAALLACADTVETLYANIHAFFRFGAVTTTAPLYTALNNPGQYCAITFSGGRYLFAGPDGSSATYAPTAIDQYGKPVYICGFLVGTPAVPDMTTGSAPVAYDLACPNCYDDKSLNLRLTFSGSRALRCTSSRGCGRTYDLDNGGRVSSAEGGRSLFRYRLSYAAATGTLLIQN